MAVSVRTTVVGAGRLGDALRRISPRENPDIVGKVLRTIAFRTQAISTRQKIKRGGKGPPVTGRLTSRTGTGRRSIGVNLAPLPRASEVGSDLAYMAVHETGGAISVPPTVVRAHTRTVVFGRRVSPFTVPQHPRSGYTANFPRRPWLEPAVDDVIREAPSIGAAIWERES